VKIIFSFGEINNFSKKIMIRKMNIAENSVGSIIVSIAAPTCVELLIHLKGIFIFRFIKKSLEYDFLKDKILV
jgi:hypothetical protein